MFDSARSILDKYIDTSHLVRFTFYSVEMERGQNPEDLYYLCTIKDHYYVVFETDYILGTLADVAQGAAEIFEGHGLASLHWLVKKDSQRSVGAAVAIDVADKFRGDLVSDQPGSASGYAVKHAVIEFAEAEQRQHHRFDPNTYGNVS